MRRFFLFLFRRPPFLKFSAVNGLHWGNGVAVLTALSEKFPFPFQFFMGPLGGSALSKEGFFSMLPGRSLFKFMSKKKEAKTNAMRLLDAQQIDCLVTAPISKEAVRLAGFSDADPCAALPDPEFRVSCTVKYDCHPLDCQYLTLTISADSFQKELQEARTFCLMKEIEYLMANNLIVGGSLDNAVVIQENAIFSKEGLRYPDEFVRHKILDIVGDIFLLGGRFRGHIIAIKPGHPSNVALAQEILKRQG